MPEDRKKKIIVRIRNLGRRTESKIHFDSCLSDVKEPIPGLECGQRFNASEKKEMTQYITKLYPMLTDMACKSTEVAEGLIEQAIHPYRLGYEYTARDPTSTRNGLATQFTERIFDKSCAGLRGLSPEKKKEIQDAAKQAK
ncbi:MAG: hypothetical protein ACLQJ7_12845 [Syntrophobacteraceae bacterium]